MSDPTTKLEALTLALYLAVLAPTEDRAEKAITLAAELSMGMSPLELDFAKHRAEVLALGLEETS